MPPGKTLIMNLQNPAVLADMKKNPVTIKEGIEYKCALSLNCLTALLMGRLAYG